MEKLPSTTIQEEKENLISSGELLNFNLLFESSPGLYLVLLPDFTIYAVTNNYLKATMTTRAGIVGKSVFEVFPDNPDDKTAQGVSNVMASFNYVLKNKKEHKMPLQKYDIKKPNGEFEVRYWSPLNKPVLNDNNEVVFIIHSVKDVTPNIKRKEELQRRHQEVNDYKYALNNAEMEVASVLRLNAELKKAEIEIKKSEAFTRGILSSLGSYIAVIDWTGHIISLNESWEKATMQQEADTLLNVFPGSNYFKACERAIKEGNSCSEKILHGLRSVLNKEQLRFEIEYPSHLPGEKRWFMASVTGFEGDNTKAVLRFANITERKKSEFALIDNKNLIQSIYDASPDAVIIVDAEGVITKWDEKSEALFGWKENEVMGVNLSETIMPPRYQEIYLNGLKQFVEYKEGPLFKKSLETTALHKSGVEFYISLNVSTSIINRKRFYIGFIRDISERKKAEQLLFSSQRLYKNLLDNMNDGFMVDDIEGRITFANEQFCEIFGIENANLTNIILEDYVDPEYRTVIREMHNKRVAGENVQDAFEFKGRKTNGESIWLDVRVNPIFEKGEIKGTQSVIRDITKKKIAEVVLVESEIKIRNFASHLNQVLEDERTNLAREIHDELGQQLAGIKYGISSIKKLTSNNEDIQLKISELMNDVDTTIQVVRKIATELRPGILDTLGLASSIEWLVKEYGKKKGVKLVLNIDVNEQEFSKSISTCFFRICQESLTNISKHAEADEILVSLFVKDKKLVLIIKDNGKGISINKQKNPFSMGLIGMKERVNNIGGHLEILSEPGKGTCIITEVKIN